MKREGPKITDNSRCNQCSRARICTAETCARGLIQLDWLVDCVFADWLVEWCTAKKSAITILTYTCKTRLSWLLLAASESSRSFCSRSRIDVLITEYRRRADLYVSRSVSIMSTGSKARKKRSIKPVMCLDLGCVVRSTGRKWCSNQLNRACICMSMNPENWGEVLIAVIWGGPDEKWSVPASGDHVKSSMIYDAWHRSFPRFASNTFVLLRSQSVYNLFTEHACFLRVESRRK